MTGVEIAKVTPDEAGLRLDRWFRRRYPGIGHGRLAKLLRTGQVRVDGRRAKGSLRLAAGQSVRVPPLGDAAAGASPPFRPPPRAVAPEDEAMVRGRVLHRDDHLLVIDKPPGLAVQGGSRTVRHLDALLDALRFGAAERPRLVHRLDKDTSGVLVLARSSRAAAFAAEAFRRKAVDKLYWAAVVGLPRPRHGRVDLALAKRAGSGGEKVGAAETGKRAVTLYHTVEAAGRRAAWLALVPLTGRTHQIRAHCAALGVPIIGDAKYGGAAAFPGDAVGRGLHLHARAIRLPHPAGGTLRVSAPLPAHMRMTWAFFGFDPEDDGDPFADRTGVRS